MRILLLMLVSCGTLANSINFGMWSHHTYVDLPNENNHQLISLEINNYIVATFINSYSHRTYMFGKNFKYNDHLGLIIGLTHGYDKRCIVFEAFFQETIATGCNGKRKDYQKDINPFFSFSIEKKFGPIKLNLLEGITQRTFTVGFYF